MQIFIRFYIFLFFLFFLKACGEVVTNVEYPETKKINVVEDIFDQTIEDPYRWLEDFTSNDSRDWVEKQNALTNKFLSNTYQKRIKEELQGIWISDQISIPYKKGDKTFYFFNDGKNQQSIFMMEDAVTVNQRFY